MSPITPSPVSTASNATQTIINKAFATPGVDAANGLTSVLEALNENNITQWLMLALAIPAGCYALYQLVICIRLLVGRPHRNTIVAVDTEGVPVQAGDIDLATINNMPPDPMATTTINDAPSADEPSVQLAPVAATGPPPEVQPVHTP